MNLKSPILTLLLTLIFGSFLALCIYYHPPSTGKTVICGIYTCATAYAFYKFIRSIT